MAYLYTLCAVLPFMMILCWQDWKYRKLPNLLTIGLAVMALIVRLWTGGAWGLLDGILGGLVCGGFLLILFLLKSVGGGDVKMLFAAGVITGLRFAFAELLFVSICGLLVGLLMLCFGLVASTRLRHYLRVLFDWRYDRKKGASELPPKTDERMRVPFGVAIAAGTVLTLLYAWYLELGSDSGAAEIGGM